MDDGQAIPAAPEEEDGAPRSDAERQASVRATLARIRIAGFRV